MGIGIFVASGVYWLLWAVVLPRLGKYELVREGTVMEDGWTRNQFVRRNLE